PSCRRTCAPTGSSRCPTPWPAARTCTRSGTAALHTPPTGKPPNLAAHPQRSGPDAAHETATRVTGAPLPRPALTASARDAVSRPALVRVSVLVCDLMGARWPAGSSGCPTGWSATAPVREAVSSRRSGDAAGAAAVIGHQQLLQAE